MKTALLTTQEVVIGGWTPGAGRRAGTMGALLLGAYDPAGQLRYLGNVGTGFTDGALRNLLAQLTPLQRYRVRSMTRCRAGRPGTRGGCSHGWGEVVYRTLTADNRLRHAAWRGLRPDRDPEEIAVDLP